MLQSLQPQRTPPHSGHSYNPTPTVSSGISHDQPSRDRTTSRSIPTKPRLGPPSPSTQSQASRRYDGIARNQAFHDAHSCGAACNHPHQYDHRPITLPPQRLGRQPSSSYPDSPHRTRIQTVIDDHPSEFADDSASAYPDSGTSSNGDVSGDSMELNGHRRHHSAGPRRRSPGSAVRSPVEHEKEIVVM